MRRIGTWSVVAVVATALAVPFFQVHWTALAVVFGLAGAVTWRYRRWTALTTVAMFAVLFIAMTVVRELTWVEMKQPVTFPPPGMFPVLIVGTYSSGSVEKRVVYFQELEERKKAYASWTFLVPERNASERLTQENMWAPSYTAREVAPGRQKFDVHGSPDDDVTNRSWYVATRNEIIPEFHEYYGRSDQAASCIVLPVVLVAWFIIAVAVIVFVHQKTGQKSHA